MTTTLDAAIDKIKAYAETTLHQAVLTAISNNTINITNNPCEKEFQVTPFELKTISNIKDSYETYKLKDYNDAIIKWFCFDYIIKFDADGNYQVGDSSHIYYFNTYNFNGDEGDIGAYGEDHLKYKLRTLINN